MTEAKGHGQRFVSPDAATPRPWKVTRGSLIRVTGPDACVIAGVHKQGFYVGEGRQGSTTIALANAELIVRCVNSHDALVAALEGFCSRLCDISYHGMTEEEGRAFVAKKYGESMALRWLEGRAALAALSRGGRDG